MSAELGVWDSAWEVRFPGVGVIIRGVMWEWPGGSMEVGVAVGVAPACACRRSQMNLA